MPARISSAAISAWRSEKVKTRSGSSARIFGMSAEVKAETRGFPRRTWAAAPRNRIPHNAVLLTDKVKRFDRLLRQADDPGGRKLAQCCRRSLSACRAKA